MNAPASFAAAQPLSAQRLSPVLWTAGILSVALLFWADFVSLNAGRVLGNAYWGRDFVNVWTAGHLVRSGDFATLYDVEAYRAFQRSMFGPIAGHNYSYPPVSFPLAAALSMLPYSLALAAWIAGTGAFFAYACRRWWPVRAGPSWLVLLTPAALLNIWAGHYSFVLGGLFLLGWQRLDRHPVQAGVLFGCMLIKPHLALMVGVALLARREWRAVATGALTALTLVALTGLAFGWQLWSEFLFGVGRFQSSLIDAGQEFFGLMSTSTATALHRFTDAESVVAAVQLALALGAAAAVALAARSGCSTRRLALFAATCTFVALPYGFNYDLTVVMVAAATVLVEARRPWQRIAGGAAFLCPMLGMVAAAWSIPLIPLALLGLAVAQWRWLAEERSYPHLSPKPVMSGTNAFG